MGRHSTEAGGTGATRVGLVGCVKRKLGDAAPAADLYVSTLFRGRRAYVEQSCGQWLILSALHGVVRPDAVIEPYDATLNDASRAERRAWAARVLQQLDDELGSCDGLTFEIHAGANYTNYGVVSGLQSRGATVERPAAGLGMGQQLALYSDAVLTRPGALAADVSPAPVVPASVAPNWSSEEALTEWMSAHLRVAVHPHDDRDSSPVSSARCSSCSIRRSTCDTCRPHRCGSG